MKLQDKGKSRSGRENGAAAVEPAPSREAVPPGRFSLVEHRWGRALINLFILYHLFALTIWLIPPSALQQKLAPYIRPYMAFTGFMQGWTMFSPNPSDLDVYVEARITYADKSVRSWNYPRMVDLGYWERYRHERFRKLIENAHLEKNSMVWPSLAAYAARRNHTDPTNPPVSVELVRHWRLVPPPGEPVRTFNTYTFFKKPISPKELR